MIVDRSRPPVPGVDPPFALPRRVLHQFDGGLRVWTVEHRAVPALFVLALLPVGAAADPPGQDGLAAFTADLLDEATVVRDGLDLHEAVARIGGELHTEVHQDATAISLLTLARHAREGLDLLAEIVATPRFHDDDVARVRDLRVSRVRQLRNVPSAVADRAFLQRLYRGHPYGHTVLGSERSLATLTGDDVRRFHGQVARWSDLTIIAVGDVGHDQLAEAVNEAFAPYRQALSLSEPDAIPVVLSSPSPVLEGSGRLVLVHRPGAPQSELRVGSVAARRTTPDYHALVVLNTVLGGQFVSRINLNLRERRGLTYGARSSFDCRLVEGPFAVQASVQTDATAVAVQEVLDEIRGISSDRPVNASELEQAKNAVTLGYARNFETAEQIATAMETIALYGLPVDHFDTYVADVLAVGAGDVTSAARRYLLPERQVVVVVGDRDRIGESLIALGLGDSEVVEID